MDLQSVSLHGKIMDPQKLKNICHNLPSFFGCAAHRNIWVCLPDLSLVSDMKMVDGPPFFNSIQGMCLAKNSDIIELS